MSVPDAEMLVKISEVLNVPVSDLLGKKIAMEPDNSSLDMIASELEKLNELLVTRQTRKADLKKKITSAAATIIFILFVAVIYDKWNEIFYEFGKNIYHWIHSIR